MSTTLDNLKGLLLANNIFYVKYVCSCFFFVNIEKRKVFESPSYRNILVYLVF